MVGISQSYVVLQGTSDYNPSFPTRVPTSPARHGPMQNIHFGFILKVKGHHKELILIIKDASQPNFIECQIGRAGGKLRGRSLGNFYRWRGKPTGGRGAGCGHTAAEPGLESSTLSTNLLRFHTTKILFLERQAKHVKLHAQGRPSTLSDHL